MFRRSLTALAVAVAVAGTATIATPAFAAYPASVPTVTKVSAPTAAYGATATVAVAVTASTGTPTGSATVKVAGRTASLALKSGKASYAVKGLAVGSYTVSVSYPTTAEFKASSASTTLKVVAAKTSTKVSAGTITVGAKATLKASVSSNGAAPAGTVTFKVNGKSYKKSVSKGSASVSVSGLPVGSYTVTATFTSSSTSVLGSSAKTTLKVAGKKTSVKATKVKVSKGHRPTVTVKPSVTGRVTLTVTGPKGYKSSRTVRVTGGHSFTFSVSKSVSAKGTYSVKVSLKPESSKYASSSTSSSVKVK